MPADFDRSRHQLIETHLTDDDIVEIITALKEKAKQGNYEAGKALFELKYGKNPEPPSDQVTLEQLLYETPTGPRPDSRDI